MKLHDTIYISKLPSRFWTELYIIKNLIGTSDASLKNQAMKIKYHYSKCQEKNREHIKQYSTALTIVKGPSQSWFLPNWEKVSSVRWWLTHEDDQSLS
jgi:hypothetical protein